MEKQLRLTAKEVERLLELFDNETGGQKSEDRDLWLKIRML